MGERNIGQGSEGAESSDGWLKTHLTTAMLTGAVVLAE